MTGPAMRRLRRAASTAVEGIALVGLVVVVGPLLALCWWRDRTEGVESIATRRWQR